MPWQRSARALLQRLAAHWRLKLALTAALNVIFWTGYASLSRHALFPLHTLPATWLDRAIPFQPEPWGWIYMSEFLLTGVGPWLITDRRALADFTLGLLIITGAGFLIFLLYPVASPRPAALPSRGSISIITHLDGPLNAFPSLHAAFLVYMLAVARRLWPRPHPATVLAALAWAVLVLYATLATRQHYSLDLVAGAALGLIAHRFAWRPRPRVSR